MGDAAGEHLFDEGVEDIERKEYQISGICIPCQRAFFVEPEEEEEE